MAKKEEAKKGFLTLPNPNGNTFEVAVDLTRLQLGQYSLEVKHRERGNLVGKRQPTPFTWDFDAAHSRDLHKFLERMLEIVAEGRQQLINEYDEVGQTIAALMIDTLPLPALTGILVGDHEACRLIEEGVRTFLGKCLTVARMCAAAATDSSTALVSQLAATSAALEEQVRSLREVLDLAYESLGGTAQPQDDSLRGVAAQFVRSLQAANADQTLVAGQRLALVLDRTQQTLREPSPSLLAVGLRQQLHALSLEVTSAERDQARLESERTAVRNQLAGLATSNEERLAELANLKLTEANLRVCLRGLIDQNDFEAARELLGQLTDNTNSQQRLVGEETATLRQTTELRQRLTELATAEVALANTANAVQTKRRALEQALAVLEGRTPPPEATLAMVTPLPLAKAEPTAPPVSETRAVTETSALGLFDALPLDILEAPNHIRGTMCHLQLTAGQLLVLTASGNLEATLTEAAYAQGSHRIIRQATNVVVKFFSQNSLLTDEGQLASLALVRQFVLGRLAKLAAIRESGSVTIAGRTSRQGASGWDSFCWFIPILESQQLVKVTAKASTGLAKRSQLVFKLAQRAQIETLTVSADQQAALASVLASQRLRLVPHHLPEFTGWLEVAASEG